jgi:lycopene beta-cyclase
MKRNVDVVVISPSAPWHATYGSWRDDVADAELGAPLESVLRGSWDTVRVVGNREHLLQRPYVVFDNSRLRAALMREVSVIDDMVNDPGNVIVHNIAHDVSHGVDTSTIRMASGSLVEVALVIDATGSRPMQRGGGGAQTAYGLTVDLDTAQHLGVMPGVFTLMDWSRPPTFLYGAPFADGSVLVEETSLYADPPRSLEDLAERLGARLGPHGATTTNGVERVTIPMGGPLPDRTARVVAFGASAGYVHPVTGYSVAASLRAAPRVAEAISVCLAQRQRGDKLAKATWDAVWPAAQLRTRAWHAMGLDVLQSLPDAAVAEFFDAFFSLPMHQWSAYLRVDASPREVRRAMLGVFRGVGAATRLRLMSSPGGLWRAIVAR